MPWFCNALCPNSESASPWGPQAQSAVGRLSLQPPHGDADAWTSTSPSGTRSCAGLPKSPPTLRGCDAWSPGSSNLLPGAYRRRRPPNQSHWRFAELRCLGPLDTEAGVPEGREGVLLKVAHRPRNCKDHSAVLHRHLQLVWLLADYRLRSCRFPSTPRFHQLLRLQRTLRK